jgi:hypothetical protein
MPKMDITKCNAAIDKLLETTTNPRHRYILMAYARHRHLEFSGNYEGCLTSDMMADHPIYTIRALGVDTTIDGKDQVRTLYKNWAETNDASSSSRIAVAVADNLSRQNSPHTNRSGAGRCLRRRCCTSRRRGCPGN